MDSLDIGLGVLHVATGTFFTITGFRKLFVPRVHARVAGLFKKLGVGGRAVEWAVPAGEFAAGLGLLTGTLTPVAAGGALIITAGAYYLDTIHEVEAKNPSGICDWVAKALCTPEGQLLVILVSLIFTGPGKYTFWALF